MKRLLVVDDALFMRKMICGVAAEAGWEVVAEATNGAEAVALYQEHRPDLVTMDLVMPVMGGLEALRQIRAIDPDAKVVVVTALDQKQVLMDAISPAVRSISWSSRSSAGACSLYSPSSLEFREAAVATSEQEDREDGQKPPVERVRVLVVDDSALMRRLLTDLLGSAPEIEVVGTARDGRDAVLQASRLRPDVVTLDVEMPEASGIDALPLLLGIGGLEVVMVSALTQEGADVTLHALELGAFDCLPKPEKNQLSELRANRDLLVGKVIAAASSGRRKGRKEHQLAAKAAAQIHLPVTPKRNSASAAPVSSQIQKPPRPAVVQCVLIGISTGGPQALARVFPELRPPCPPIIVVQHMPAQFTGVFAQRLDRYTTLAVETSPRREMPCSRIKFLVAPGGMHLVLKGTHPHVHVGLTADPPVSGHRPSVDVLFHSGANVYQRTAVGILMTGMGRDGVAGCKAPSLAAAGGFTLGQDEESSAVYGMNKAAYSEGAVKSQFALDELPGIIANIASIRAAIEANASS